jgi:hypothetical protein
MIQNNKKVISLECGKNHGLILCEDSIFSFGDNSFGQLGKIEEINEIVFKKIIIDSPQQPNTCDCGYYTMNNLKMFIEKEENNINKYNQKDILNLRNNIRGTIDLLINEKKEKEIKTNSIESKKEEIIKIKENEKIIVEKDFKKNEDVKIIENELKKVEEKIEEKPKETEKIIEKNELLKKNEDENKEFKTKEKIIIEKNEDENINQEKIIEKKEKKKNIYKKDKLDNDRF